MPCVRDATRARRNSQTPPRSIKLRSPQTASSDCDHINEGGCSSRLGAGRKAGILVVAKEELELLAGTVVASNAEEIFAVAEKRLRDAQEHLYSKVGSQTQLDLL